MIDRRGQFDGCCLPARGSARCGGVTIIELMVAVSVLVIILLVFNMVLGQAQKVVTVAEAKMRTNAAATSITELMRKDLQRVTKNGFLCITQNTDRSPRLFFATAGPAPSVTTGQTGSATITGYGLCGEGQSTQNTQMVLWHCAWILRAGASFLDSLPSDLSKLISYDPGRWNEVVNTLSANCVPTDLTATPTNLTDLGATWMFLARNCSRVSIMWTDGTWDSDQNLNWYGIAWDEQNNKYLVIAKDEDEWRTREDPSIQDPEYEPDFNIYRALWTRHDQQNWPVAIKIRFCITEKALPARFRTMEYEAICPVGR